MALVRSEMRRMLLGLQFAGIYVLLRSDTRVRFAYDSPANIQTSGGTGPMLRHLSLKKIAARKLRVLMSVVALLIFVTMLVGGTVPVVYGATLDVTKTADTDDSICDADCSLREAIGAAGFDDTIMIPAGTYTLTLGLELTIDSRVTLIGAGEATTIIEADILPGVAGFRVFNIADVVVDISEVTIRHGNVPADSAGGINQSGISANLTLTNTSISDNTAAIGGGLSQSTGGLVNVIMGSVISGNTATAANGGGIDFAAAGSLEIVNSTISGNTAGTFGGGLRTTPRH